MEMSSRDCTAPLYEREHYIRRRMDERENCQRRKARGAYLASLRYASLTNISDMSLLKLAGHNAFGAGYPSLFALATSPVVAVLGSLYLYK